MRGERGIWGVLSEKILNFDRFYVRFNRIFMRLRQDFSSFGHDLLLENIVLFA